MTGNGLTVIVTSAVVEQLFASAAVTVYVVVDTGETVTLVPVKLPGIQV